MNLNKIFNFEDSNHNNFHKSMIKNKLTKNNVILPKNFHFNKLSQIELMNNKNLLNDLAVQFHIFRLDQIKYDRLPNAAYNQRIKKMTKDKYINDVMNFIKMSDEGTVIILDDTSKIAAMEGLRKSRKYNNTMIITSLFVKENLRGMHLGTSCLEIAENIAIERGFTSLILGVYAGNSVARRLYKKFGFKEFQ